MLQNLDIYVTPVLNVDGYMYSWTNESVSHVYMSGIFEREVGWSKQKHWFNHKLVIISELDFFITTLIPLSVNNNNNCICNALYI